MSSPRLRLIDLQDQALERLHFIRETMAASAAFSSVPGIGTMLMGVVALAAAVVASTQPLGPLWLVAWLVAAGAAVAVGVEAMRRKARRRGESLRSGAGRKFALALMPPLAVGALLTAALARAGHFDLLPGVWLASYGAAIVSAGAFSVRVVPLMGSAFLALGAVGLLWPDAGRDLLMALGFGALHLVFGAHIARRHGG